MSLLDTFRSEARIAERARNGFHDKLRAAIDADDPSIVIKAMSLKPDDVKWNHFTGYDGPTTPFYRALVLGKFRAAEAMFTRHPEWLEDKGNTGTTPLIMLARQSMDLAAGNIMLVPADPAVQTAAVRFLKDHGANMDARDNKGNTALYFCMDEDFGVLSALADCGADINARNDAGQTPLMQMAGLGSVKNLDLLIQRGARLDETDNARDTAIACALKNAHPHAATMLVSRGAAIPGDDVIKACLQKARNPDAAALEEFMAAVESRRTEAARRKQAAIDGAAGQMYDGLPQDIIVTTLKLKPNGCTS